MTRMLGVSLISLCVLVLLNVNQASAQQRVSSQCGAYGQANHCQARWDNRSKSCVC
jgi:hypothetical protein